MLITAVLLLEFPRSLRAVAGTPADARQAQPGGALFPHQVPAGAASQGRGEDLPCTLVQPETKGTEARAHRCGVGLHRGWGLSFYFLVCW